MDNRAFTTHKEETQVARAWNMLARTYNTPQRIDVVEGCFAFMFTNLGDVIARVNGMVIFPNAAPAANLGDSRAVAAHVLDLYKGKIELSFAVPTAGVTPLVEIVQLFYTESFDTVKGRVL